MARADLLCELIKAGLRKDDMTFRRATQAICAEERTKQHEILANKIEQLLKEKFIRFSNNTNHFSRLARVGFGNSNFIWNLLQTA